MKKSIKVIITVFLIALHFKCKNEKIASDVLSDLKDVSEINIIADNNDTLYSVKNNIEIKKILNLFTIIGERNHASDTVSREMNHIEGHILIDYNNKKMKIDYGTKSFVLYGDKDTIRDLFTINLSEFLGGLKYCNPYIKKIAHLQFNGIVASKYENSNSAGEVEIELRLNNLDTLISLPLFDESKLYDYLQPDDSLIKIKGSSDFKVIRKNIARIFKVKCY